MTGGATQEEDVQLIKTSESLHVHANEVPEVINAEVEKIVPTYPPKFDVPIP